MLPHFVRIFFCCFLIASCAPSGPATAPNPNARIVDQLSIAGNACGPASLLTAFRFGSPDWQKAADVEGETDTQKLRQVIIKHGGTWSSHIRGKYRWSSRGINAADLTDVANELAKPHGLSTITLQIPRSLKEIHTACATSLRNGLPPVAGVRRYDGMKIIDAHFITILTVPDLLEKDATQFSFTYADPMRGKKCFGTVEQTGNTVIVSLPETPVGKAKASPASVLHWESIIGDF